MTSLPPSPIFRRRSSSTPARRRRSTAAASSSARAATWPAATPTSLRLSPCGPASSRRWLHAASSRKAPIHDVIASQSRYPDDSLWSVRRQQSDPLGFLRALAARGDFVRFTLSRQPAVLMNRPDYAASVLVSRAAAFRKGSANRRAKRLLGEGLLTADGDRHAARRRAIQPVFGRQRLEGCASVIVERARETCDAWRPGQIVDITRSMGALTFGVLGEVIVGAPVDAHFDEVRQIADAATATMDPLVSLVAPLRSVGQAHARLRRVAETLLEHGSRAQEGSLLALLREHDPEPASHAQRVDDLVTLLLAGHDTLTNALTWTWLLLASHPDVEARLHAELSDVLRGRVATIAELPALVYTKAVLAEALRLYPPAWILARHAVESQTFDEGEVPRGDTRADEPVLAAPGCPMVRPSRGVRARSVARQPGTAKDGVHSVWSRCEVLHRRVVCMAGRRADSGDHCAAMAAATDRTGTGTRSPHHAPSTWKRVPASVPHVNGDAGKDEARLYTLHSSRGIEARVTNYGCTIVSLKTPDRHGLLGNIVLGFDRLDDYFDDVLYTGAVVGRYASRIANARFDLDGSTHLLSANDPPNHLHGGFRGFNRQHLGKPGRWTAVAPSSVVSVLRARKAIPARLRRPSPMRWQTTSCEIEYEATTDAPTHVNMTQHSYFNLHETGDVREHRPDGSGQLLPAGDDRIDSDRGDCGRHRNGVRFSPRDRHRHAPRRTIRPRVRHRSSQSESEHRGTAVRPRQRPVDGNPDNRTWIAGVLRRRFPRDLPRNSAPSRLAEPAGVSVHGSAAWRPLPFGDRVRVRNRRYRLVIG